MKEYRESNVDDMVDKVGMFMTLLVGFGCAAAVGGFATAYFTDELFPATENLFYSNTDHSLTNYYKNPIDKKMIRTWRAMPDGKRIINVTSLDSYWQEIADDVIRTRCLNLQELNSISSLEKVYLVEDCNCLKGE